MNKKLISLIIFSNIIVSLFGLWFLNVTNTGFDYSRVSIFEKAFEHEISAEITVEIETGFLSNNIRFMNGNELVFNDKIDNLEITILLIILFFNIFVFIFWKLYIIKFNKNL